MLDAYSKQFACIVGAPRSGTTFLSNCLREHPDVCFSAVKEPHYFSQLDLAERPLEALRQTVGTDYLSRFFPHLADEKILVEGSVSYLYAPRQVRAATRLWADTRFIIAVRDPLDLLPSLHQRLICTGDETVRNFDRAWALVPERMRGRSVPRSCIDPRLLQYEEVGRLGTYVELFLSAVGRERCMVVVFDDLKTRPQEVYHKVLEFLGLPPHERSDFSPSRASCGCKSPALQRLLKRPPKSARRLLAGEKFQHRTAASRPAPELVKSIFRLRRRLLDWNRTPAPPIRVSSTVRQQIIETYTFEIAKLSGLLQRDLSHWLGGAAPEPLPDAQRRHTSATRTERWEPSSAHSLPIL